MGRGLRPVAVVLKSKEARHLGAGSWNFLQNRIPLDVGTVCRDQQNSFVGRDPGPSPCELSSTGKRHGHPQGAPASSQTSLDARSGLRRRVSGGLERLSGGSGLDGHLQPEISPAPAGQRPAAHARPGLRVSGSDPVSGGPAPPIHVV